MKTNKRNYIIAVMAFVIVILIAALFIPRVTTSIRDKYLVEGYNACTLDAVRLMVYDLQTKGFTTLQVANQTIKLGVIP